MPDQEDLDTPSLDRLLGEARIRQLEAKGLWQEDPSGDRPLVNLSDAALGTLLRTEQEALYGDDNRTDLFNVTATPFLKDADCVAAIIKKSKLIDNGNGTSRLVTRSLAQAETVCDGERFSSQQVAALGTGFLVAQDMIATAAHCIDTGALASRRFVFGYRLRNEQDVITTIQNDEIYTGIGIVGRHYSSSGADWALVRLDRPVTNHEFRALRRSGRIPLGQKVHAVGHPAGLPAKLADGAFVRDNGAPGYFTANLDMLSKNSGSPVFNSDTNVVEGILVRGAPDYVPSGNCYISLICPESGCSGEDCTRSTEFAHLVPEDGSAGFSYFGNHIEDFGARLGGAIEGRSLGIAREWMEKQDPVRSVWSGRSHRGTDHVQRELLVEFETEEGITFTSTVIVESRKGEGFRLRSLRGP